MPSTLSKLTRKARRATARLSARLRRDDAAPPPWARFPHDPVAYATHVLGVTLTDHQTQILRALITPPHKVLVPSAHNTGKTFLAACAVNWWYDSFPESVALSTAPTHRDVVDLLWTEVRLQRLRARVPLPQDFLGPRAPEMRSGDHHYAKGYTAQKGESFQGRHRERMLFVFDEACGVEALYWETTLSMFDPSGLHAWLCIFNPTSTTSHAYQQDLRCDQPSGDPAWHRLRISALEHPNLTGKGPKVPGAVTPAQFQEWVDEWCEPILPEHRQATDLVWPPDSGKVFRPGPVFQARALGLWPDLAEGVWGPALWEAVSRRTSPLPCPEFPVIGCDCATGHGDDYTAIHGRWGGTSLLAETGQTMDAARIAARLREAAALLAEIFQSFQPQSARIISPKEIPMVIDDDGTGGAVGSFLRADGYSVTLAGAGTRARDSTRYPNRRSELWFYAVARARRGLVGLGDPRLDRKAKNRLRQQLLAPAWAVDAAGRRKVEPKQETKDKLGRSPDDADAMNLAYSDYHADGMRVVLPEGVSAAAGGGMANPRPAADFHRRGRSRSPFGI